MISKYSWHTLLFYLLAFALLACNPTVEFHTDEVDINIQVQQVSAGYAHVSFTTNKRAYYLTGIHPIRKDVADIQQYAKQFMTLALDSAYVDYLYWRNHQLQQLAPFVTDFASYALKYSNTDQYFTLLQPTTDYWVYAFVVNPTTNKPVGTLFLQTITTHATSSEPMLFEYRIEGQWDYVYPKDKNGEINSHTPWVGETIDSLTLREQGWETPGKYFLSRFDEVYQGDYTRILYGIHVHENNGEHDGTSHTEFEVGKTYYTGMAALDAPLTYPLDTNLYDIYRFTWMGDSTKLYFTPVDCTGGEW
jgi:hypothetical protein